MNRRQFIAGALVVPGALSLGGKAEASSPNRIMHSYSGPDVCVFDHTGHQVWCVTRFNPGEGWYEGFIYIGRQVNEHVWKRDRFRKHEPFTVRDQKTGEVLYKSSLDRNCGTLWEDSTSHGERYLNNKRRWTIAGNYGGHLKDAREAFRLKADMATRLVWGLDG